MLACAVAFQLYVRVVGAPGKKPIEKKLDFDHAGKYWSPATPGKRRAASPARAAAKPKKS